MSKVKFGDTVKIHYTVKRKDGKIFGTSKDDNPIEFVIGEEKVIPGVEKGIVGMEPGDKKTLTVQPEDAYGPFQKNLIKVVDKSELPKSITPTIGDRIQLSDGSGATINAHVADIKNDSVILDANHPLAGKTVKIDIEMIDLIQ